jgi:hypothetical protein
MVDPSRYREIEDQFIEQLRGRAQKLIHADLPADRVEITSMPDGEEAVRDALRRLEVYDRDLLSKLPGQRALRIHFLKSSWGGLLRRTNSRVRARMLSPVESLTGDAPSEPMNREDVRDALARYQLLPRDQQPTCVVLSSPTGFTADAKSLAETSDKVSIVLVGAREDGGWEVTLPKALEKSKWSQLFEFETADDLLKRLQWHLEQAGSTLDSRGLSLDELAKKLGVPRERAEVVMRQAARLDPHLLTVADEGTIYICRSPLPREETRMRIWESLKNRVLSWFGRKPSKAEQVRLLTEQRVKLEQTRHEVDQAVDQLEGRERDLLEQGANAPSAAEKKQVAGKLMRLRRELSRKRTQAQMFSNQIDVLGTQIHHLTLKAQSEKVALPSAEQLTQQAAEAEQVMSELSANADLAMNIEVGAESPMMEQEELAIFDEFEQIKQHSSAGEKTDAAGADATQAKQPAQGEASELPDVPEFPTRSADAAKPEAN